MIANLIPMLQDLVRIPSPNPPGDTRAIAEHICDVMRTMGCSVTTLAPAEKPEGLSVIAALGQGEPVIMLHAHIDTVPIGADEPHRWHVEPYAAVIENGRVYGKGSIDDKGPLAAMMAAIQHAATKDGKRQGTLVLVAAAEEETGGKLGTRWLADNNHLPTCDFIVVGEQTANHVATAHKGVVRATVHTTGRSVHATNPDRGVNAITAMARVVLALERYHRELARRVDPVVGVPTCNVGVIRGGSTANAVPDSCEVDLDRRMIPGEDPAQVQQELIDVVNRVGISPAQASVDNFLVSNWFSSTADSVLARVFLDCVRDNLHDSPGPIGYLPGSDAKHLTKITRGEMIIFGPGSYEVAHAADEYVDIEELNTTAQILCDFIDRTLFMDK